MMPGPLALVGSGEFLDVMRPVDAGLLTGRAPIAVILPTAAAEDGPARVDYWLELGSQHFRDLGVTPVPLRVLDRVDAERSDLAEQIAGAGLVYLSGGSPGYLADTLRDTAVWRAVLAAWKGGAALAGCSAGACALSAVADDFRHRGRFSGVGLGVVPDVAVLPHFDRFGQFAPGLTEDFLESSPPDVVVLGIDEDTALLGGPSRWIVAGHQAVWRLERDGSRARFGPGDEIDLAAPPVRAVAG
ncbi:MAG: cyanophycinase [Acidimicrobiaceae bacterium]|jgi:cyanophycinase|nr:cyanophycinase [Acidimicrobiaceae bacterium]